MTDWSQFPEASAQPSTGFEQFPEAPAAEQSGHTVGFIKRVAGGFNKLPRDIVDQFMEGIHTTARAPGLIAGVTPSSMEEQRAEIEAQFKSAGFSDTGAKLQADHLFKTYRKREGVSDLLLGPLQAIGSPILGAMHSFAGRPVEEEFGIPSQLTEVALGTALGAKAMIGRTKIRPDGSVKFEPVGEPPTDGDFTLAARKILGETPREPTTIEGEFTVVGEQKELPAPKPSQQTVEKNLRRAWEEDGIHPAEAARDIEFDPHLKDEIAPPPQPFEDMQPTNIEPVIGSNVPANVPRSEVAKTGQPHIDAVLDHSITKRNINNAVINTDHVVPYTAGGSTPLEYPVTFVDHSFPRSFTVDNVTFNPAEPFTIHENVEQTVMEWLIGLGWDKQRAYFVAHWGWAEPAEGAWYRAHGIDQQKAEALYRPYMEAIQARPPGQTLPAGFTAFHGSPKEFTEFAGPQDVSTNRRFAERYRQPRGVERPTDKGNLYQVNVGAKQGDFLNLDRPLSEQSDQVKAALAKVGTSFTAPERIASAATKMGGDVYTGVNHALSIDSARDALEAKGVGHDEFRKLLNSAEDGFLTSAGRFVDREEANRIAEAGAQINKRNPFYNQSHLASESVTQGDPANRLGMDVWDALRDNMGADAAAKKLRDAGIAGTSREHGVYSAFDPNLLRITHRNDVPITNDVPANLYKDPYPHDQPSAAASEAMSDPRPDPAEIAKAIVALEDAGLISPPVRSANLSPDALPRTMYPAFNQPPGGQGAQQSAGGGGVQPPPGVPATGAAPAAGGGGGGPGPPFINPMMVPPRPRAPYFTYDDRGAFAKLFSRVIRTWQETFQPELVSDAALQADPQFAEYKSRNQNLKDQIINNQEANYQYWRSVPDVDRLRYLDLLESGRAMPNPEWQARADVHRQILQEAHKLEVQWGSKADYFENYFPHIWENPQQARDYVAGKTAQVGPTWFQKERTFTAISEAMAEGLRLKTTNPEELVTMRLFSTADMLERMNLIKNLESMGLMTTVAEARGARARRMAVAQALGLPIDVTTVGRDLSAEGWEVLNAPDRQQWFLAPDARPLWANAMVAKGLWANEGNMGDIFRGWMSFKNTWVPIKLALSAFHPLHVAHINMTNHIVQAVTEATRGLYGDALRELGDIIYDPVAAAVPRLPHEGRFAREAWNVPEDARTPIEAAIVKTMNEGGIVAGLSEQLRIDSQRKLEEAWDKQQWFRMAPQLVREAIRRIGAPVFEHWIPNLKVAAYLRAAEDFLEQNPQLLNDDVQRKVALRAIGKSIENRYGEMFYGGMFWNRYVKDAGIGGFLSLGWTTGLIRDAGGGLISPFARRVRGIQRPPTQTEETIHQAQNRVAYWSAYVAGAMLINGIITYASTGEDPEGIDWALPRTGRTNPDGSPHRLTNMFYTREGPMMKKHIESSGSVVGGVADTLYGKLVVGPAVEMLRNRDYYGNEIYSETSPMVQQGKQVISYLFGNQFNPISVSGAQQALKTGGGAGEAALAMLGFGPAPSYADKTPTQNYIDHLFQRYVAPEVRPEELGRQARDRSDIRNKILMAQNTADNAGVKAASQEWFKAGGSRQGLTNILQRIPPDVSMFRALPESAQQSVMDRALPNEREKYRPYLKSDVAARIANMQVDMLTAQVIGDTEGASRIAGEIQSTMMDAVHSGKITNLGAFQRSVQQNMMFRRQPEAAAQKAIQPDVRRRMMMQPQAAPSPP